MQEEKSKIDPKQNVIELPYASFVQRIGATVLDSSVTLPVQIILGLLMFKSGMHLLFFPLLVLIPGAYKVWFEYRYGGTLGKIWLGMEVVDEEKEGIEFTQALNRYAFYFAYDFALIYAAVTLFLGEGELCADIVALITFQCLQTDVTAWASTLVLVSMIWVGFDIRKQAWHDKLAKTFVIKEKDEKIKESYVIGAIIVLVIIVIWLMTQMYPEVMN